MDNKYKILVDNIEEGMFSIDQKGTIIFLNNSLLKLLGYPEKEIIGTKYIEYIHQSYKSKMIEDFKKLLEQGFLKGTTGVININNRLLLLEYNATVVVDKSGNKEIIGIVSNSGEKNLFISRQNIIITILKILNKSFKTYDAITEILQLLRDFTGYDAIGLRLKANHDFPYYKTYGFSKDFIQCENSLCIYDEEENILFNTAGQPILKCLCGKVLSGTTETPPENFTEHGSFWSNNTSELINSSDFKKEHSIRNRCNKEGYESVALIPVKSNQKIIGLLHIVNKKENSFDLDIIRFYEEISDLLGIAFLLKENIEQIEATVKFPEQNPNPVMRISKDGKILYANKSSDIFLNKWKIDKSGTIPCKIQNSIENSINKNTVEFVSVKHKKKYYLLTVWPDLDKGYANIYGSDITHNKNREKELIFKNAILEAQAEAMIAGILVVDETGKVVSYNKAFQEIWDIPRDLLEMEDDNILLDYVLSKLEEPEEFITKVNYLYVNKKEKSRDEIYFKDGKVIHRYSSPLVGKNNYYYGRIWYFQDITESKRLIKNLEQSYRTQTIYNQILRISLEDISLKELLEKVLDLITSLEWFRIKPAGAIFLSDKENKYLSMIVEKNLSPLLLQKCKTVTYGKCLCGIAAATGKFQYADDIDDRHSVRYEGIQPHGHYCIPIISREKKTMGVINLYIDVGHKKRKEEVLFLNNIASILGKIIEYKQVSDNLKENQNNLYKAFKELKDTNIKLKDAQSHLIQQEKMASIGLLSVGIAHEINNPIAYIKSNLSILKNYHKELFKNYSQLKKQCISNDTKNMSIRKKLVHILKDSRNLMRESNEGIIRIIDIVANLKNFARNKKEFRKFNINKIVSNVLKVAYNRLKYSIEIEKDFGDIPEVECCPEELNQVILNLVINAADAIDQKGKIKIKTYFEDKNVIIQIKDTGRGIPDDIIDKIFEPFYTTKPPGKGTGLGLSISMDIIMSHNGHITVNSTPGKGSTFTITLPQYKKELKRVLIIDDNKILLEAVNEILSGHYNVQSLSETEKIFILLNSFSPDLILMDIAMPGMNGKKILDLIRSNKEYKDIKIIAFTGVALLLNELLEWGFDAVLRKPASKEDLLAVVENNLRDL